MHSELKVSQYQKFRNHDDRLNRDDDAISAKEHIIELRKEFARPGYFSPKLELEESSIDNSSEVIIDTKNPDRDNPGVIPELDINQPLSDQLLADTKDLETLETKSKRDYVKETSAELYKDQDLLRKIYKNDRSAPDPDTGKLTTNTDYVEKKIQSYCRGVLKATRDVITRHAHELKTLDKKLIEEEIILEISLLRANCIAEIALRERKDAEALEKSLINLSEEIIEDIISLHGKIKKDITKNNIIDNEFEQELDHNLLRLGYKTSPTILAESNISKDPSIILEEIEPEERKNEKPKKNTNLESLKTIVTNRITSLIGNKRMSWETCRSELLETKIKVIDILDGEKLKEVSLRELGYDFNLVGSIDKSPKEFNISMTTPSIENDHEFSIKNTKPQTFISFQVKLPNGCKGLSFIPHKRKLEDDESTQASSDISERNINDAFEESEIISKAREIPRKSLITRLGNAFKLSLGMNPDSKTSIFRNIARIFTTTPIPIYIVSILTAVAVGILSGGIGIPIAIFFGMILFSWGSRFFTASSDAFTKNLTDLSLEASGTKYRKRKFVGAIIGWVITTSIALVLNILKGVVTFGNNDFSILRTDGEERLLREIVLIRTLEAISVLGTLVIFAGLGYVGFIALSLSSSSGLALIMQLAQLSNSSFPFVYTIGMSMLSSPVALSTISTLTIIATSLAGFKCLIFLIKDALLPFIQLVKNNITLATSEAKSLLGRKERFTDSTNTLPPLKGMIGLEVLYPVLQMLQEAYPGFSELSDNEQQVLILQHMVGSEYVLDQYRTCLELSKTIAKYRAQGANTLKEIINKISRGVFNRLEDKNMIIMLRRLCDNDAEELDSPVFLNEVESNLSKSLQILLPFVSVPNQNSDIDPDRILKDSVEYKNKIYNKYFDDATTQWKTHKDPITVDAILEIGQFPDERRKYIHAMLDQSRSLFADFDKMSVRQRRINAEKLATKSLKLDWLLKQQYGDSWEKHRYTLNYKDSLLCRSIEVDKALPVANFGVSSKNIEIVIEQKLGHYFGNTEERKRLEEAMYPKKSIWLSIARFFGFKSELAKPTALISIDGIRQNYGKHGGFIEAISGPEAEEISFDPEKFSEVPCPIYPSIENVEYLTAEYHAKSAEFKQLNRALKKQTSKILKLTMELKRNIEPYMHSKDEMLLERYKEINEQIAEESQKEAAYIARLNLCEQIMNFDRIRLQQLADLNKNNHNALKEAVDEPDNPNTTHAINEIRKKYNFLKLIPVGHGLADYSEKFINPVFITSSNLQRVTGNLDSLQRGVNDTCHKILDISSKLNELSENINEEGVKSKFDRLTSELKYNENKLIRYLADARAIIQGALNQLTHPESRNLINIETALTLLKKYRSLMPNPILLTRLNLVRFFRGWPDAYNKLSFLANASYRQELETANKSNKQLIKTQIELLSDLKRKETSIKNNQVILEKLDGESREYLELSEEINKEKTSLAEIIIKLKENKRLLPENKNRSFKELYSAIDETADTLSSLYGLAAADQLPEGLQKQVLTFAQTVYEEDEVSLEKDGSLKIEYIKKQLKNSDETRPARVKEAVIIPKGSDLEFQELIFKKSQILDNIVSIQIKPSALNPEDPKFKLHELENQLLAEKFRKELAECNRMIERHPKKPAVMGEIEPEPAEEIDIELNEADIQSLDSMFTALHKRERLIELTIEKKGKLSDITSNNIAKIKEKTLDLYKKGMKEQIEKCYERHPTFTSEKEYLLELLPTICNINEAADKGEFIENFATWFIDARNIDTALSTIQAEVKSIIKGTSVAHKETVEVKLEGLKTDPEAMRNFLKEDANQVKTALSNLEETLQEDLKRLESERGADIPPEQLKAVNPMFEHTEQLEKIYPQAYFEDVVLKPKNIEAMERFRNSLVSQSNSITSADDFLNRVSVKGRPNPKEKIEMKLEEKSSIHEEDSSIMRKGQALNEKNEDPEEAQLITSANSSAEKSNDNSVNFDNPRDQAGAKKDYTEPDEEPVNFVRKALNFASSIFVRKPIKKREAVILTNAEDIRPLS